MRSRIQEVLISVIGILLLSVNAYAQSQTNYVTATITVTNVLNITNGSGASITVQSQSFIWTNASISSLLLQKYRIAATNTTTRAATNLYTKLSGTFGSALFFGWSASNAITIRAPMSSNLTVTLNTNWGGVSLATNTASGGGIDGRSIAAGTLRTNSIDATFHTLLTTVGAGGGLSQSQVSNLVAGGTLTFLGDTITAAGNASRNAIEASDGGITAYEGFSDDTSGVSQGSNVFRLPTILTNANNNIRGIFTGNGAGLTNVAATRLQGDNSSPATITAAKFFPTNFYTVTNTWIFFTNGSQYAYCTNNFFGSLNIGDDLALSSVGQFRVASIFSSNKVFVLENTGGMPASWNTNVFTVYPAFRIDDINGRQAGFIGNDGSYGVIVGSRNPIQTIINSGKFNIIDGTNSWSLEAGNPNNADGQQHFLISEQGTAGGRGIVTIQNGAPYESLLIRKDSTVGSWGSFTNRAGGGFVFWAVGGITNKGGVFVVGDGQSQGRYDFVDANHSIIGREGGNNAMNFYEFGGTTDGYGYNFYSGGLKASQTRKFSIRDDYIQSYTNMGVNGTLTSGGLVVSNIFGKAMEAGTNLNVNFPGTVTNQSTTTFGPLRFNGDQSAGMTVSINTNYWGAGSTISFSGAVTNNQRFQITIAATVGTTSSGYTPAWTNSFSANFSRPPIVVCVGASRTNSIFTWYNSASSFAYESTVSNVVFYHYGFNNNGNNKTYVFDVLVMP